MGKGGKGRRSKKRKEDTERIASEKKKERKTHLSSRGRERDRCRATTNSCSDGVHKFS
jgi:hypothetical protein